MTKLNTLELGMVVGGELSYWEKMYIWGAVTTAKLIGMSFEDMCETEGFNMEQKNYAWTIW